MNCTALCHTILEILTWVVLIFAITSIIVKMACKWVDYLIHFFDVDEYVNPPKK